jgi:hypothetical protein
VSFWYKVLYKCNKIYIYVLETILRAAVDSHLHRWISCGGIKCGGSSAVVISGDPGNPTFLDVRHQCGPEYTMSLEVKIWGLWLALDCLDDEAVAAGVLI